ncbi:AEC family transporter [Secundilactobacillus collinoides]|uniref:Malate transporter n=1 Tax=Secundilactobacillus collinoides TaxID=33960 RepID=A0A166GSC6_SECCO|nr:AEC family transporter [Secundilactobacillus collinoides]KZL40116.1 malate transporter [Secundilactobacillus collinoides]
MLKTLIFALLPIIVTIALGYFAAARDYFDDHDSQMFVRLVMNFMLPLSVFSGIWSTPRKIIIKDIPLAAWLLVSMVGCYIIFLIINRYLFHTSLHISTLRAMSVADPSVPFIGSAILPLIFGASQSAITIGVCTLIINILILPTVFATLSSDASLGSRLLGTLKKPLVAAALLGFILALVGWQMPEDLSGSFELLGKGAGGLAIFATGIVLFTRKILVNRAIVATVFSKNILFPIVIWGIMLAFGATSELQRLVVLTLAIPTATMPTTLAIQFNVNESELASTQFWSTVCSFITLAAFLVALS